MELLELWNMRTGRPQESEQGQLFGQVTVHKSDFSLYKFTK